MNQEHRSGDRRNKDGAVWTDKRHGDRRVSPAVGQFAIQDAAKLRQINKELVAGLGGCVPSFSDSNGVSGRAIGFRDGWNAARGFTLSRLEHIIAKAKEAV